LRYCFALVTVVIVMEVRRYTGAHRVTGMMDGPPFTLMLLAVICAAAFGGVGPGVLATLAGAVVCDYLFIEPRGTLLGNALGYDLRLGLFTIEGIFISYLIQAVRRSSADQRRTERNLRLIADNTSDVIFAYDMSGQLLYVNAAFEALTGDTVNDLRENPFMNYVHPDDSLRMQELFGSLFRGKSFRDVEYRIIAHDGRVKWCRATWGPLLDEFANPIGVQGRETEITEQKHNEATLRFLADACGILAKPGDPEGMLGRLARAAVPQYADWCVIDLLDESTGAARTVAAAHADASKEPWVAEMGRDFPPRLDAPTGAGRVLATGQPEILSGAGGEAMSAASAGPRHLKLMQNLAPRSRLIVPMRRGDRTLGAITFVWSAAHRRYDADDLIFAADLARRVADAIGERREALVRAS
jgi:PAS domain S-box-containing protein